MTATKTYCVSASILWLLRMPDGELQKTLRRTDGGGKLNAMEMRQVLIDKLRQGFDYLPACANVDAVGLCAGHCKEEAAT